MIRFTLYRGLKPAAIPGGGVGVGGGKGGEVVGAEDVLGGAVEGFEIEGPGAGPDEGSQGRGADAIRGWWTVAIPLIAIKLR